MNDGVGVREPDEGAAYNAGFDDGMMAALQQICGLMYEGCSRDDLLDWVESQMDDAKVVDE